MPRKKITDYNADRSPEERRELASRAGKASAAKRKEKKAEEERVRLFCDILVELLAREIADPKVMEDLGAGRGVTYKTGIGLALIAKGLKGDVSSIKLLLDVIGESPGDSKDASSGDGAAPLDVGSMTTEQLLAALGEGGDQP